MKRKAKVIDMFADAPNPAALQDAHWRTTDIANAAEFITAHGDRLRYAHGGGGWHRWQQGRWKRDVTEATSALAQQTVAKWWREVGTAGSPEEREILAKHFLACGKAPRIQAMLTLAAAHHDVAIGADAFDRDPWRFTCANGTIDLRTGELCTHDPADLISKRSPVAYDPHATCPRFLEFLSLIFDNDQTLIDFIQRAGGYSLTGSVDEHCLFFLWGTGRNGKSTLIKIVRAILGEHATGAAPSLLMAQHHDSHPTEIAALYGARMVSAIETEQDRRFAEAKLKWFTGGDPLTGRFMKQDFFEFEPTHKLWIAGNHKPIIAGTDPAIWSRMHLVPFVVNLEEKLKDDLILDFAATLNSELPGILRWLVDGALLWRDGGLKPPDTVRAATGKYRDEMDAVAQWLNEFCERDPRARTAFRELYTAYAAELKTDAKSKRAFAQDLDRLGIHDEPVGGVKFRVGVRLRSNPA